MTEDVAARTRALAGALVESGFALLRWRDGETEIELRRSPRPPAAAPPDPPGERAAADGGGTPAPRADLLASDVVGIVRFHRPPVIEGAEVEGDRELAYVEALGIRNPVRSRGPGRVGAVLVSDGQPVEYGQPLFAIER